MPLYFDVTLAGRKRHFSGLQRVSGRLRKALRKIIGDELVPVRWRARGRGFSREDSHAPVTLTSEDCFISPEVFSPEERPGFFHGLEESGCRSAIIYHDAIPLKWPEITWPVSVARHPSYMKALARFHHIFAVSRSSAGELEIYLDWLDMAASPPVSVLPLGADFADISVRNWRHSPGKIPLILSVGILEPRKNQSQVLALARRLWDGGLKFELHFCGRVNPHFGKPVAAEIKRAQRLGYSVFHHSRQSDELLLNYYAKAHFSVLNSKAEGFGLPLVESLWLGVPCLCSDLPSHAAMARGGGCRVVSSGEEMEETWKTWLCRETELESVTREAKERTVPLWADAAASVLQWMREK